jgi:hypothetical protein
MANLDHLTTFMPTKWHLERTQKNKGSLISLFVFLFSPPKSSIDKNLENGAAGEMQTAAWINSFTDDQNYLINNVLVPNNFSISGDTEIDLLWVGPHGIRVVEVKAYTGEIEIFNSEKWNAFAPGSNKRSWTVKNPINQCMTQAKTLRKYLKSKAINIPIQGIIVMPSAHKVRIIDRPRLPVLGTRNELVKYYKSYNSDKISSKTIENVVFILNQLGRN